MHCGHFRQADGTVVKFQADKMASKQDSARRMGEEFWPTVQNTRPACDPEHPFRGRGEPCPCGR